MIEIRTAWNRPYRPLQGDHAAALMIEMRPAGSGKMPVHVQILLDISGSMEKDNKLVEAKKAVTSIIDQLSEQDTLSIIAFNDYLTPLADQIPVTGANKEGVKTALKQLKAAGITLLDKVLEYSLNQTISGMRRPTFIILISDGRPTNNQGIRVKDYAPYHELATKLGTKGGRIIAVALGDPKAYEADFFNELAMRTGGPFRYSPHAENLQAALTEDLKVIQNTALESVEIEFQFNRPSSGILLFGRANPDKQVMESDGQGISYSLGALGGSQAYIYVANIVTTGSLDVLAGRVVEGRMLVKCQTPSGPWSFEQNLEIEYTNTPEYLNFIDKVANNWYLELAETDFTLKGIRAQEKGDDTVAARSFDAAKKTRKELDKKDDVFSNYIGTRKDENRDALARLLQESRRPQK